MLQPRQPEIATRQYSAMLVGFLQSMVADVGAYDLRSRELCVDNLAYGCNRSFTAAHLCSALSPAGARAEHELASFNWLQAFVLNRFIVDATTAISALKPPSVADHRQGRHWARRIGVQRGCATA
ncbi:hypothetical protein Xcaj_18660 [Xanthomonas axonopodis pv. cajani]|uniref:Transposase n=1 Tax=Xanthomonas axonopodis pv. cajani TaxID=487827 RepID=A0ABX3M5N4_9XANT|nr:hypothetical protein Xcaj_18660 [Xanthomonas axonopodis pv. cajani]